MKTIGLIGGMSWQSSAEYYRIVNESTQHRLGSHNNARSLLLTVNFQEVESLQRSGNWDQLAIKLQTAAQQLQAGGADFIVLCTNTMHKLASQIEQAISIPLLHIADPTAVAIVARGLHTVGLLGTKFTMEEDFYRARLEGRHHLRVLVPSLDDRDIVHRIIYDELCHGIVAESSREQYRRMIQSLVDAGAEAIILGCTEIGLLIHAADSAVPLFDTTQLHAEAAVTLALA